MNDAAPPARRRLRFSILTLLVATTIIALAVTVVLLYRELVPLRREVARLRDEVGELSIEDPSKLHAIRVDPQSELEWKWRIWIPEGATYQLRNRGGPIPREGFPGDGGTMYLREPGEHVIRYVIRRDPRDNRWIGSLHTRTGSMSGDEHAWVEWGSKTSTAGGIGLSTQSFPPGERVEIIRYRTSQVTSSANIEDPAPGFMIWLEPIP
jgi:hypothetical protein